MQELSPGSTLLILREEELRQGLELIFLAQRDLEAVTEPALRAHRLTLAQFRVIRMIRERQPLSVGELAALLGLTKQSLGRLIDGLVDRGLVIQKPGPNDRRLQILALTPAGTAIERSLWEAQRPFIMSAYRDAGPRAVEAIRALLSSLLIAEEDRQRFVRSEPTSATRAAGTQAR